MSTLIIHPYVSKPFLQRFEPLLKEKGLDTLKLHGDLSAGPPHPFLQIEITGALPTRRACPTCQTPSMVPKVSIVASFRLQALPSCCGVLVSSDSFVAPEWRRQGLGRLMQDMKEFLARQMRVGKLIATVVQGNLAEEKLLTSTGWTPGKPFTNGRSGSVLIEWEKVLENEAAAQEIGESTMMVSPVTAAAFIRRLQEMPGAIPYDGDASVQVAFQLANGRVLRIGSTDPDVGKPLWADSYEGLFGELKGPQPR